jgi:hypothetical protein
MNKCRVVVPYAARGSHPITPLVAVAVLELTSQVSHDGLTVKASGKAVIADKG